MAKRSKAHPGFKAVQASIANQPNKRGKGKIGKKRAGAILASRTRAASAAARKRNPNLNRVRGGGTMRVSV